jgi:hypothetical protein
MDSLIKFTLSLEINEDKITHCSYKNTGGLKIFGLLESKSDGVDYKLDLAKLKRIMSRHILETESELTDDSSANTDESDNEDLKLLPEKQVLDNIDSDNYANMKFYIGLCKFRKLIVDDEDYFYHVYYKQNYSEFTNDELKEVICNFESISRNNEKLLVQEYLTLKNIDLETTICGCPMYELEWDD